MKEIPPWLLRGLRALLSVHHSYKRVHARNVIYDEVLAGRLYTRATQQTTLNNVEGAS